MPVRSALIGAIVGVLGVVGCLTFRSGLTDVVHDPQRSGIVWDAGVAGVGVLPPETVATVSNDPAVAAAYDALWARAIKINGTPTPTFGTKSVTGDIHPVVLAGRAPRNPSEIAFAPTTMRRLGLHIGDRVPSARPRRRTSASSAKALLPETSHTSYDQSAWMTAAGLAAALPTDAAASGDFTEDYLLLRWRPHADPQAALGPVPKARGTGRTLRKRRCHVADGRRRARRPARVAVLTRDLLRAARDRNGRAHTCHHCASPSRGSRDPPFDRLHQTRLARVAIAWQATLLAIAGLVVGVPLGILAGRLAWKQLANSFPLVYAPPLAILVDTR